MILKSKINLEEYKNELMIIYPFLTDKDSKEIIENIVDYWTFIFENMK